MTEKCTVCDRPVVAEVEPGEIVLCRECQNSEVEAAMGAFDQLGGYVA